MRYSVVLTSEAEDDLMRIAAKDPVWASCVLDHLDRLAENPGALSRRASFPHLPFQKYPFYSSNRQVHFTVLFKYGDDEKTLYIVQIGHVDYGFSVPDDSAT